MLAHIDELALKQLRNPIDIIGQGFKPRVGYWIAPPTATNSPTSGSISPNLLLTNMIVLQRPMRFDRIGLEVTAGATNGLARLGVYNCNPDTYEPTSLILDAGEVDVSTAGLKEIAIDLRLERGFYHLATILNVSGISLRYSTYVVSPIGSNVQRIRTFSGWVKDPYTYGPLPNPFPTPSYGHDKVLVMLRVAELL
jgi:hypothetical protein